MTRLGLCAVFSAAIAAAFSAAPAVAAPQCYEMRFEDTKGVLIPVNPPIIGIMIGETPLYEGAPPVGSKFGTGRMLPCPAELVASAQKAFDDFCTSDQRRQNAAAANGVDLSVINKRCNDLTLTLAK